MEENKTNDEEILKIIENSEKEIFDYIEEMNKKKKNDKKKVKKTKSI